MLCTLGAAARRACDARAPATCAAAQSNIPQTRIHDKPTTHALRSTVGPLCRIRSSGTYVVLAASLVRPYSEQVRREPYGGRGLDDRGGVCARMLPV